jgi:hypothetical protein
MSGYVEVGYVVVLGSIAGYAVSLVSRERAARRRLAAPPPTDAPADGGPADDCPPEDRPPATAAHHGEPS